LRQFLGSKFQTVSDPLQFSTHSIQRLEFSIRTSAFARKVLQTELSTWLLKMMLLFVRINVIHLIRPLRCEPFKMVRD